MRNRINLPATAIFAVASLLVGCGGLSSEQKTAASDALKALKKISAATEVGVNYQQYGQMVIEAKAQVNEAAAKLPDGELKKELSAAMDAYADARETWAVKIQHPRTGLQKNTSPGSTLIPKYSLEATAPRAEFLDGIEAGAAVKIMWLEGQKHLDRASKLLAE